ncbi:hypothetical protein KCU91_g118, partial [Aureobasidium melanogenum]
MILTSALRYSFGPSRSSLSPRSMIFFCPLGFSLSLRKSDKHAYTTSLVLTDSRFLPYDKHLLQSFLSFYVTIYQMIELFPMNRKL